jgi:hypothetical protein
MARWFGARALAVQGAASSDAAQRNPTVSRRASNRRGTSRLHHGAEPAHRFVRGGNRAGTKDEHATSPMSIQPGNRALIDAAAA